MKKHFLK
jgi:hypothetical protein